MKYCSNCGTVSPDEAKFCVECGTKFLIKGQAPVSQQKTASKVNYIPIQSESSLRRNIIDTQDEEKPKEKTGGLWIKAIFLVIVLIIFSRGCAGCNGSSSGSSSGNYSSSAASTSRSTSTSTAASTTATKAKEKSVPDVPMSEEAQAEWDKYEKEMLEYVSQNYKRTGDNAYWALQAIRDGYSDALKVNKLDSQKLKEYSRAIFYLYSTYEEDSYPYMIGAYGRQALQYLIAKPDNYTQKYKNQITITDLALYASLDSIFQHQCKVSTGRYNAYKKALSYLNVSSFSYSGLYGQLQYEGFTDDEAAFGVNWCGADWNEQAKLKAASYLKIMSFSKSGLIDQLEYEGFTYEQAVYGVEQNGY